MGQSGSPEHQTLTETRVAYDFEKALEGITPAQEGAPLPAPAAPKAKYDFEQALGGIVPTQADTAASMFTASFENPDEQAKLRKLSASMAQYIRARTPTGAAATGHSRATGSPGRS